AVVSRLCRLPALYLELASEVCLAEQEDVGVYLLVIEYLASQAEHLFLSLDASYISYQDS
ncbi:MAG: hypothetical protein ACK56F_30855, partial [bacterium]